MQKLFAVYLGGRVRGTNIEMHDVVFVVGESIKATFPRLKALWFGEKYSAHVDAFTELAHVDGFRIELLPEKPRRRRGEPKLYFANVGSATSGRFGENHDFHFFVAGSREEAKTRAQTLFPVDVSAPHLDNLSDIDTLLKVDEIDGWFLRLNAVEDEKGDASRPLSVTNVYWPLRFTKDSAG